MTLDHFLARLDNVRRSGDGYTARCPAHDDTSNSLAVGIGDDGRILVHCFVACSPEAIVAAVDLTLADLFEPSPTGSPSPRRATVADLANVKRLPVTFLVDLGLSDQSDGVRIAYRDGQGELTPRQRLRTSITSKDAYIWIFGPGKVAPYGLDRLVDAREQRRLVLVEGESDCWTLWFHGFPALGIPGAASFGKLEADHVVNVDVIYVIREPDAGGDCFVPGVGRRLRQVGWLGDVREVRLADFKDPSALHCADPDGFKRAFQNALDDATVVEVDVSAAKPTVKNDSAAAIVASSGLGTLSAETSPAGIEAALRAFAAGLVGLDSLARAMACRAAKDHLIALGIKGAGALVDSAVKTMPSLESERRIVLEDIEPADEAVAGERLADEVFDLIRRYVAMDSRCVVAVTLWVFFTHCFNAAEVAPMLAILSPIKRCGKTTLLEIVSFLVPRRIFASNMSPAAMYRVVDQQLPTLLVDEADTFLHKNDELRGILNAGHYKSTAFVMRTCGDDHEPVQFFTWCPKAIALIGKLRDTLEDRSIVIRLRRRRRNERVEKFRRERLSQELEPVRRRLARWAQDHLAKLTVADPDVPEALHDRAADNWRLLLAIADEVGAGWPESVRDAAVQLSAEVEEEDGTTAVRLLADIKTIFDLQRTDFVTTAKLLARLHEMEERPWGEWGRSRKPMSARALASQVAAFDVKSRQKKIDGKNERGYDLSTLQEVFFRYLPPDPLTRDSSNVFNDLDDEAIRYPRGTVPCQSGTVAGEGGQGSEAVPDGPGTAPSRSGTPDPPDEPDPAPAGAGDREEFDL